MNFDRPQTSKEQLPISGEEVDRILNADFTSTEKVVIRQEAEYFIRYIKSEIGGIDVDYYHLGDDTEKWQKLRDVLKTIVEDYKEDKRTRGEKAPEYKEKINKFLSNLSF